MALITIEFTPGLIGFMLLNVQFFVQCFIDHCFYCFLLTFLSLIIVLSILLRFTASKYTFCNFKAFLTGIGAVVVVIVGFTTTYMQSVPITPKVVSSNPVHDEEYSIQHYGIIYIINKYVRYNNLHSFYRGSGGSMSQVVGSNISYKPITNTALVRARLHKFQKGCT